LLARAVAGEAGVPFLSVSGSTSWRCSSASVRAACVTSSRRAQAGPAIIFVDEIDSIGRKRGAGSRWPRRARADLNQMLSEMDGFDVAEGIVVMAATNRPTSSTPRC